MSGARAQPNPRIFWLARVMVFVIAGLAVLGLVSLKQDRRAAERDAEFLATALAESLARDCRSAVAEAIQRYADDAEASRAALLRLACGGTNAPSPTNSSTARQLPFSALTTLPRARCV